MSIDLRDCLDALYAHDTDDTSTGVDTEALRASCIEELTLRAKPGDRYPRVFVGRMVRTFYLSETALRKGYGPEDALEFLAWLAQLLGDRTETAP